MSRICLSVVLLLSTAVLTVGQTSAPDAAELTKLLNDFLAGASRSDPAMHDRFWAEDLIYTRSAGRRVSKAEVMRDVRSAPAPKPDDPKTTYTAEDVRIQQYGDTAIVAFRLVGSTEHGGSVQLLNFLNTGTFLKRAGKWQVVAWQSTRLARSEEQDKKDVRESLSRMFQAMLLTDVKRLRELTDESFIWVHSNWDRDSQKVLLEKLSAGSLKYSMFDTTAVQVNITGDTAIVRGILWGKPVTRSRSRMHNNPFMAYYTLVFVNQGGAWKAVAMQTTV